MRVSLFLIRAATAIAYLSFLRKHDILFTSADWWLGVVLFGMYGTFGMAQGLNIQLDKVKQ